MTYGEILSTRIKLRKHKQENILHPVPLGLPLLSQTTTSSTRNMHIRQSASFLSELVRMVCSGSLAPAAFQRPYVWERSDVLALIESIMRGYPIGGFLLWTPHDKADLTKAGRHRLGPIVTTDGKPASSLLLDGQNRLATMAWLAHDFSMPIPRDLSRHEKVSWGADDVLVVDLLKREFRYSVPGEMAESEFLLPTAAVLDSRIANKLIRKNWSTSWSSFTEEQKERGLKWLDQCQSAFREARVTVTEIEHATAEEAKDAFLHICRVGVPMSEADFDASIKFAL